MELAQKNRRQNLISGSIAFCLAVELNVDKVPIEIRPLVVRVGRFTIPLTW